MLNLHAAVSCAYIKFYYIHAYMHVHACGLSILSGSICSCVWPCGPFHVVSRAAPCGDKLINKCVDDSLSWLCTNEKHNKIQIADVWSHLGMLCCDVMKPPSPSSLPPFAHTRIILSLAYYNINIIMGHRNTVYTCIHVLCVSYTVHVILCIR